MFESIGIFGDKNWLRKEEIYDGKYVFKAPDLLIKWREDCLISGILLDDEPSRSGAKAGRRGLWTAAAVTPLWLAAGGFDVARTLIAEIAENAEKIPTRGLLFMTALLGELCVLCVR